MAPESAWWSLRLPPLPVEPQRSCHRPAIPVTLLFALGILSGVRLPGWGWLVLLFFSIAVMGLLRQLSRGQSAIWSPLAASFAVGYLCVVPWVSPIHGPDHLVQYVGTGFWRIRGVVVQTPIERFGRTRTVLTVRSLSREGKEQTVRGRIRLTVMGSSVKLKPADVLVFPAKLSPFRNFKNPGGFDYRRYMAFKGIHASAWVRAEKLQRAGSFPQSPVDRYTTAAHRKLDRLIDAAGDDSHAEEKAVLKALVYGDRSDIDDGLRERFNRAGAGHLLAISGLHVGIVAAVAFALFRRLFSLVPFLLWRGWSRQWAAAAALVPVLAYGVLAGMSPSTQRAEIMVGLFFVALILGRTQDGVNTLALAALVILVLFPPALFSRSFQFSFAAVAAIVYGLQKMQIVPARGGHGSLAGRISHRIKGFVWLSVLAIAGTAPLALFHFNRTSFVGVVANLLLIPLVGFLVVPLGLVSAAVSLLAEPLAVVGFSASLRLLGLALAAIDAFARWPLAALITVTPSVIEICVYYLIAWSLLNLRSRRVAHWVLAGALVVGCGDVLYWSHQRFWHRDLVVTAIDVGQGGATLMEAPGGSVLLCDGGGFSDNRFFDLGKQVVAPLLWRKKIATVDTLVLTHPNADHLNGLIYIAKHFHVRELWTNRDVSLTKGYKALMNACETNDIDVRRLDASLERQRVGSVNLAVLHPPQGFFSAGRRIDQADRNNGSLVVKVRFGKTAFLLTGDIEARAEKQLLASAGDELAGTVLFAPHHGSRSSSTWPFISAVNPQTVVISAGEANRFGFPHAEVTARYRQAGCRLFCTAEHGAITMRSDGRTVRVEPHRSLN